MSAADRKPLYETLLGQMAYSTLRIETADRTGRAITGGTGFIFQVEVGGFKIPLVITNRHVVEGAPAIRFQLHEQTTERRLKPGPGRQITVPGGAPVVIEHPDPEVDLAAIQLLRLVEIAKRDGWTPFYRSLQTEGIADAAFIAELDAVTEVYMVGYPNGLYDAYNNLPVVRRGITATPAAIAYEGRPEFMVDMAVYRGSSGSPVFVNRVSQFVNAQGQLEELAQLRLLGVLHSGHQMTEQGEIVSEEGAAGAVVAVQQMINLGVCVNASALLAFEDVARRATITQAPWERVR